MHWNSWSAKPISPHMEQTVIVVSMAYGVVEFGFTHLHEEEEEGEREREAGGNKRERKEKETRRRRWSEADEAIKLQLRVVVSYERIHTHGRSLKA